MQKYPDTLLEDAKAQAFFNEIQKFARTRNPEKIDKYIIAMAANCLAMYAEAIKEIKAKGTIQVFKTGHANVSAQYTVAKDAVKQFIDLSNRIGLDAKARQTILESASKKADNPFSEFIK